MHIVKEGSTAQPRERGWSASAMAAPSALRLLRWEAVFFLSDEAFHLVRAASDLGMVMDAVVYGTTSMTALVRVLSALFLLAFHTLFLGPRTSLASDAAVLFGDMQFHFFHMLLGSWQLAHYLWTVRKREARAFLAHWLCFLLHTGLVWIYTSGIQVSVRTHIERLAAGNAPRRPPPPGPPAEDPEAAAAAAARAADSATARIASHRRNSRTPHASAPATTQPGPSCTAPHSSQPAGIPPTDVFRELGNSPEPASGPPLAQSRSPLGQPSEARKAATDTPPSRPERTDTTRAVPSTEFASEVVPLLDSESRNSDSGAVALMGSATRTLSASATDSSSSALVPYVERELVPRSPSAQLVPVCEAQHLGHESST